MTSNSPLPRLDHTTNLLEWATRLINDLELVIEAINRPAQIGYLAENHTPTRTLDAATATTADVADVLATLIEDLKARGHLSQ